MPLYDCGAEDCEECQQAFRGVKPSGPLTREEIVDMIRNDYDPVPSDWPARHRGWDDGAEAIADQILARLQRSPQDIEQ
jgi:hypothetical protein